MIFWCLIGLVVLAFVNNVVRNRRIGRYNRNIDRHNQMMEMLQKNKEASIDDNTGDVEKTE